MSYLTTLHHGCSDFMDNPLRAKEEEGDADHMD